MKIMEATGEIGTMTNAQRPVNMDDKNKVWRRDQGEAWLKKEFGEDYKATIDEKIKTHYQ